MTDTLIEKNINDCPAYCQNRTKISPSEDRLHILEVNGVCPLCGNSLLENKGKRTKDKKQLCKCIKKTLLFLTENVNEFDYSALLSKFEE